MGKKKKILFYSGHCEIVGGDARYFFDLISNINQDKYEIEVFADKNYLFEKRAKDWLSKDITINYLNTRPELFKKGCIQNLYEKILVYKDKSILSKLSFTLLDYKILDKEVYRWIFKIAKELSLSRLRGDLHNIFIFYRLFRKKGKDIHIFHFNNGGYPGKMAGLIAIIIARICGVKNTIMTIQNLPHRRKFSEILSYIIDVFIRKHCKAVIAVSNKLRNEMNSRRKFPLNRITTIFHGLREVSFFSKENILEEKNKLNIPKNNLLLLITANLSEDRKGHAILFKALREVRKEFRNFILLVVGDGNKEKELVALRNNYKLNENIVFLGYQKNIEVINGFIDIAVVPSIDFEGIPYTIREAMRAGKPVITTDAGGCDEAIRDGVNGLVISQDNADALAKAILKLLKDGSLRSEMGEAGRRIFEEQFRLSDKMLEHEWLYDRMIIGKSCVETKSKNCIMK